MSSNILLISTNQCDSADPVFPLGLACLNAALPQAGHRTVWYDYLAKSHPLEEVLISSRPDYIVISLRNIDDVLIRKRETYFQSLKHVVQVCEAILRRNIKISWGCFLRPQGLDPELLKLMARAGLTHIEFGSDSFSDEVLNAYQKHFTFDDILLSSESALAAKIDFCHFLIAGGPCETNQTLEQTFECSLRLKGAVIMAVVGMRIYPGKSLFQKEVSDGLIDRNADLLTPTYYLERGLTVEGIFEKLQSFARRSPNWIVGDPVPGYRKLIQRLRQRGAEGPLWSYFAQIQRLWPGGINVEPAT